MLRKLDSWESIFDDPVEKAFINSRSVTLESKIDFYGQLDLLKKAIHAWRKAHPLLQSKILRVDDGQGNVDKYFHLADETVFEKLSNVKFLSVDRSGDEEIDFWLPLLEREFTLATDSENGPLWRLVFIQSKHDVENTFRYNLLFTANHAILDGRNAFYIVTQLLNVIESVYLDKPVKLVEYECLPSLNDQPLIKERYAEYISKHHEEHEEKPLKVPEKLRNTEKKNEFLAEHNITFLDVENKSVFKTYNELLKEENHNGVAITRFPKEVFEKLVKISKLKGVKLTGTFNSIILAGLQEMYKEFLGESELKPILNHVMVNLRPFLQPLVDNYMMGYYTTSLKFTNTDEIIKKTDGNKSWKDNFWTNAINNSKTLHDRINAGEHIDAIIHGEVSACKLFASYYTSKEDYLSLFAYNFSNLGDLTFICETENRKIKIKEHFSAMNVKKNLTICDFNISVCSIDSICYWTFAYNKRFFKPQALKFFIDKIQWIANELVKD